MIECLTFYLHVFDGILPFLFFLKKNKKYKYVSLTSTNVVLSPFTKKSIIQLAYQLDHRHSQWKTKVVI